MALAVADGLIVRLSAFDALVPKIGNDLADEAIPHGGSFRIQVGSFGQSSLRRQIQQRTKMPAQAVVRLGITQTLLQDDPMVVGELEALLAIEGDE